MPVDLLDAIERRFACRQFDPKRSVSAEQLELILQAGRLAPSAFGLEPWRFLVVEDAPARQAIAHACLDQPVAQTAAAFIAIVALVADLQPDAAYVRQRLAAEARGGDPGPILAAYRAQYHADSLACWAQGQCNFAAAHMLLQAAHLGLGSCPLGGFDPAALAAALSLSPGETPALVVALGHCSEARPERIRKPLS